VTVAKKVGPSVVQIESGDGLGSGIIFDDRGDIVTNAHVVGGANSFQVTFGDGKRQAATLVGSFPAGDIAVVHVGNGGGLRVAAFADSTKLEVGDIVMAIGNPLGLRSSVTNGIVSAVGRTVSEGNGFTLPNTIQTSAPINPGNSGGALVDLNGSVVGIPTLAAVDPAQNALSGGSAAAGIGFAIPSSTVTDIARQLIASGKVTASGRAYLGIHGATSPDGIGAIVVDVTAKSPAEKAGIQSTDVITGINGAPVHGTNDLNQALATLKPGDVATLNVVHADGTEVQLKVTLGQLPGG
jgi:S1-C subfamily serine protease